MNFLENKENLNHEQIELLAYVLKEQGELSESSEIKLDFFRKAYFLLNKVELESISFSIDRQMKLAELKQCLD